MNYEESKKLADFINMKMSYARHHKKEDLPLLQEFVDEVAKMFEYSVDRKDWYNLCLYAVPPQEQK